MRAILPDRHHCRSPFANRGGHPFSGTMTDIPCRENTRGASFQQERITLKRPSLAVDLQNIRTCDDEPSIVEKKGVSQPFRGRFCSYEYEQTGGFGFFD